MAEAPPCCASPREKKSAAHLTIDDSFSSNCPRLVPAGAFGVADLRLADDEAFAACIGSTSTSSGIRLVSMRRRQNHAKARASTVSAIKRAGLKPAAVTLPSVRRGRGFKSRTPIVRRSTRGSCETRCARRSTATGARMCRARERERQEVGRLLDRVKVRVTHGSSLRCAAARNAPALHVASRRTPAVRVPHKGDRGTTEDGASARVSAVRLRF